MRKQNTLKRIAFFLMALGCLVARAQNHPTFSGKNIFKTDYFIENKGQFDAYADGEYPVLYGVQHQGNQLYFNKTGIVWQLSKEVVKTRKFAFKKTERNLEEEKEHARIESGTIKMHWLNANPNCEVISENKSSHYFTFGEASLSSYGYKKITYKNLYKNIDLCYLISEDKGVKYNIILHPGAHLSDVQFIYSGQGATVKVKGDTLCINNKIDPIMEYGLQSFYMDGRPLKCEYSINEGIVGFKFDDSIVVDKTITIDPWISSLSTLNSGVSGASKCGYDVDFDYTGNLFVYGGGGSVNDYIKIAKYSVTGSLVWTFSGQITSISWYSNGGFKYIGNFVVDKVSGKVYTGQGFNNSTGTTMVRLKSDGSYDNFKSTANTNFNEIWEMAFDCKTGNILGMGGGTTNNINMGVITSSGSYSSSNVTGYSGGYQDIASSTIDNNGDLFVAMASASISSLNNVIIKLNNSLNGKVWLKSTYLSTLAESDNKTSVASSISNGINALAANPNYLFYYDGRNVVAFDKASGDSVGQPYVITGFNPKYYSGIYADNCDNLYLGGNNGNLVILHFNGSRFNGLSNIYLSNLSGAYVHDIKYNSTNNLLYVCGADFVATVKPTIKCDSASIQLKLTQRCNSSRLVEVLNDTSGLLTFIWFDSTANDTVRILSNTNQSKDSLASTVAGHVYYVNVIKNALCGGAREFITFMGGGVVGSSSFTQNICAGDFALFNGKKYFNSGIYTDTVKSAAGCDSVLSMTLNVLVSRIDTQQVTICQGDSFKVGNKFYFNAGVYADTIINQNNCKDYMITLLSVLGKSYSYKNVHLCDNEKYNIGNNSYSNTGTYFDTLTNAIGCDSIVTTVITKHNSVKTSINVSVCSGETYTVGNNRYSISGNYIDTLTSYSQCDSIVTTALTVLKYINVDTVIDQCMGDRFVFNNHFYDSAGQYIDTVKANSGCDSIYQIQLNVHPTYLVRYPAVICEGNFFQVGNNRYSKDGSYTDTLQTYFGCDSIVITDLTVIVPVYFNRDVSLCDGEVLWCGGKYQSTAGTYSDTLLSYKDCDSIVITRLSYRLAPIAQFDYTPKGAYDETAIAFINKSINAQEWWWDFDQTPPEESTLENPVYTFMHAGIFNVKLGVKNITTNCYDTITKPLEILAWCRATMPNAFTVNKDGLNDIFAPVISGYDEVTMTVYNRWGEELFSSVYNPLLPESSNNIKGWDGKFKDEICQIDVYLYKINIKNKRQKIEEDLVGTFTLMR